MVMICSRVTQRRSLQSKDVAKATAEVVSSFGLDRRFAMTHGSRNGNIHVVF